MKVLVDNILTPPKGWIVVRDFFDFKRLLATIKLSEIEVIDFAFDLGGQDFGDFDGADCANYLIETAQTDPLPACMVHEMSSGANKIINIINKYNADYKYDAECIRIITKVLA